MSFFVSIFRDLFAKYSRPRGTNHWPSHLTFFRAANRFAKVVHMLIESFVILSNSRFSLLSFDNRKQGPQSQTRFAIFPACESISLETNTLTNRCLNLPKLIRRKAVRSILLLDPYTCILFFRKKSIHKPPIKNVSREASNQEITTQLAFIYSGSVASKSVDDASVRSFNLMSRSFFFHFVIAFAQCHLQTCMCSH